jgi:hypothetical protein
MAEAGLTGILGIKSFWFQVELDGDSPAIIDDS